MPEHPHMSTPSSHGLNSFYLLSLGAGEVGEEEATFPCADTSLQGWEAHIQQAPCSETGTRGTGSLLRSTLFKSFKKQL